MHRIDGPGATVDNRFTDGDPVGGVQATMVTDDWANDVQEELMSILAAAAITPVKGTQNQVLQAIRKIGVGVVGALRNGRMSVTTASATATFTADELVVKSALGGSAWLIPSFSKSINLATTGAGGMDTGTAPVSGFVALYAIFNPSTGVSALLGVNATSAAAPSVYGGVNMPVGYTASALISVWPTNGSSLFAVGLQVDRLIEISPVIVLTSTTLQAAFTPLSIAGAVPLNAKSVTGVAILGSTVGATISMTIASSSTSNLGQNNIGIGPSTTTIQGNYSIALLVPQTFYYTWGNSAGSPSCTMYVASYTF